MSGIYISGMEMPHNCFLCNLSVLNGERLFCKVTKEEVLRAKIATDCPLIAVPNHGRLIDADALQKSIEYVAGLDWNINVGASKGLEAAAYMVEDAMTIIPADKDGEA